MKIRFFEVTCRKLGDHAHTLARAGIGSLPIFGNAAVELFKSLVTPLARDRARAGAVLAPV